MTWNRQRIRSVALASAPEDYAAFEAIGLSEIPGACVLDVGCFDGFNTVLKFAPYANVERVVGIDPSAEALALAAEETGDVRFSWEQAACETYAGASESFDVAYFGHSLQHLADKEAGLRNVFRLLKPGGFVVVKTVDDGCKVSHPDPDGVMRRLFALYEEHVLPNVAHTRHTDRNNGSKCYTLLQHAGFAGVQVRTTLADTAGKSMEERRALFERNAYFRGNIPDGVALDVAAEIRALLERWGSMFEQDDYYFASPTFVAVAQKPAPDRPLRPYFGPLFGGVSQLQASLPRDGGLPTWCISPLAEADLGQVMRIELESFPDPWTPVAYAMELRYNTQGTYVAARNGAGEIGGYVGWWEAGGAATIANIAVDPHLRRCGLGRLLLDYACAEAAAHGCAVMQLQVRAQNATARSFYAAMGFAEMAVTHGYYTNPDDDAVILAKTL